MIRPTSIAALVSSACLACSALAATPVDQMQIANTAVASQERAIGTDYRSADDFILPGLFGTYKVQRIQVVMIGNGFPSLSKFCLHVHMNNSALLDDAPGNTIKIRLGASSYQNMGPTGIPGQNKYVVSFNFANGELALPVNQRFWVSAFARYDDSKQWGFGRRGAPMGLSFPSRMRVNTSAWFTPTPIGDHAFKIITY